jgi:hypothetical protein
MLIYGFFDLRGNYTITLPLDLGEFVVPANFSSDGASIPRFFWRIIGHPFSASRLYQSIGHDYLYRVQPHGWSRRDADRWYLKNLKGPERFLIYLAVRIGGYFAWKKHQHGIQ